jgi:redox-sensitive bicupin YhaK (pirin superfamily)
VSNLETRPAEAGCAGDPSDGPVLELLEPRKVWLGKTTQVSRLLPNIERRMVGAWCFVDHYGPDDITGRPGMRVPPHPHTSLQTVTWLLDGEVLHRDSVGSRAMVLPGELNIMTSGRGISHSEETPAEHGPLLHGVQLWVALPEGGRHATPPAFSQHRDLPTVDLGKARATVLVGSVGGATSPAHAFTPLLGVDVVLEPGADVAVPVRPDHEHAVLVVDGPVEVAGAVAGFGQMLYLGRRRDGIRLSVPDGARRGQVLLLGGEPFSEEIVMWWNFIGRSHDEIVEAREEWTATTGRFGHVQGYDGDALPAPPLPTTRLKARGRRR